MSFRVGAMIKVNVANYIIHDLQKRFPMQNENIVDTDIIDVLVDRWSHHQYVAPNSTVKLNHPPSQNNLYLM